MKLNNLKYKHGSRGQKKKIFGRGPGSGSIRGFKGNKGQGQRSTVNVRRGFEGGQTPIYMRVAKIGFNNYEFKKNYNTVTLAQIQQLGKDVVNTKTLVEAKIIKKNRLPLKIIGTKDIVLSKKYQIEANKITAGAKETVEKAGGSVSII
ncbi:MAG: 50S ribosomal protein L15 [Mycoplasmataceae bacterium]|jgi:large subunit ribosomal protein L15|nr:50S ribosomal protein L15 [Mycoplasmataceae bacterium]